MAKACDHCNAYVKAHGAFQGGWGPQQPVTTVTDHASHSHGQRVCDDCKGPFNALHHSFDDPSPDAPVMPGAIVDRGWLALVHRRCVGSFNAKREAALRQSEAETKADNAPI